MVSPSKLEITRRQIGIITVTRVLEYRYPDTGTRVSYHIFFWPYVSSYPSSDLGIFKIRDLLVSEELGFRDVSLSVLRTAKDSHHRPIGAGAIATPRTPSAESGSASRIQRGAPGPGGTRARGAVAGPARGVRGGPSQPSLDHLMAEQPGAEAVAPEAPATLEQVLRSVQALTASVGQLAVAGQQTQVTVGRLESSVTLTTNACNALADKVGKIQTQVDGGAAAGKKKDEGWTPRTCLPTCRTFRPETRTRITSGQGT
eukprot:SAG31_NODE_2248_length_6093_cov_4.382716_2_plen_258_part_00